LTLAPLIVWTSYATALNFTLLRMNPSSHLEPAQVAADSPVLQKLEGKVGDWD